MRKALVVGSEGNIGAPLVRHLRAEGYDVLESDIRPGWRDRFIMADINHPIDLLPAFDWGPEVVFLLSAMVSRVTCEQASSLAIATNLGGINNVLQLCKRVGARLVFFSTSEVYGPDCDPMDDAASTPRPNNRYGLSKLLGEQLVEYEVRTHGLGAGTSQEGTPLVYDGVIYMPNPGDYIQAYDAKTDRWVTLAPMPAGRHGFGGAVIGPNVYFVGGSLTVEISNVWLIAPAGTVTVGGTVTAALSLDRATIASPGVATVNATVPVKAKPPGTASIPKDTLRSANLDTVSIAAFVLPEYGSVAVIVATTGAAESIVMISNVRDISPPAIATVVGTTTVGLLLASNTWTPPSGAGAARLTVPVGRDPPIAVLSESDSACNASFPIVKVAVLETPE